jgi:dihydrolipoamide dehydrogenase
MHLRADGLLVGTGREPNTEALELSHTGVETDARGFIVVDDRLRTTNPRIFAYGDVIGREMFKHTSRWEGEHAYRNSKGADVAVSYRANPHAVFAQPQIGSVGLTEDECEEQEIPYRAVRRDYRSVAKGRIMGSPDGFAKLLVDPRDDRILGFHMIGPQAADLIHEVVVAMNAGDGKASTVRRSIHVHPTLSELVRAVFDAV